MTAATTTAQRRSRRASAVQHESDASTATRWSSGSRCTSSWRRATKLFSGSPNRFGDEPNTNIDPVTLGLPGALPVLNRHAVELAMRIGLALNCTVQPCAFARKNYFYPDMPKAYQISQYDQPLNVDGWLDLPDGTRVGIERAHMEEDAGKSMHAGGDGPCARRRLLADRPQPGRRAAGRDRQPPRHPLARAGARVRQRAAGDPARDRRLRRQDGGGLDARRRQRQRAQARRAVRHAVRDQERQLDPLDRAGDRVRGEAPDPDARARRDGPPADAPLGRGRQPHAHAARQGGSRRLPLLPRARPRAARPVAGMDRARSRAELPMLPAARRRRLAEAAGAARRRARP